MNVSDQIIQVLDEVSKKLGMTIDWSAKNVMPYVKDLFDRYIHYEIISSIIWILIFVALSALIIKFVAPYYTSHIHDEDYFVREMLLEIFFVVFIIAIVAVVPDQIFDIIKCIYVPELKVYEYINFWL